MPANIVKSLAKKADTPVSRVEKLWKKALQKTKDKFDDVNYAYTVGILKKMLGLKEEILREDTRLHYAIPTFVLPTLFESFLEEDDYAYYLTIPSYLIEQDEECGEDCDHDHPETPIPIIGFQEVYSSDQDLIKFTLVEGKITEEEVKVAILKEARLDQYSNQISWIIRRTSDDRIKYGTEWARAKLIDVIFSEDPDQITFRWRTEPTEHERKTVKVKGGGEMTTFRNVARGAVDTVPDIVNSRKVASPSGKGTKVNFSKDTAYTMEVQFVASLSWKKDIYKKISKKQISEMIKTAKVRFFCSCPHFNWGAIAYNLTKEDASIQPQTNPGIGHWNSIHKKPHKLCKHLRNLLKGFVIWENSMVGMVKKKALEREIEY